MKNALILCYISFALPVHILVPDILKVSTGLCLIFRIHAFCLMISLELITWSTISISTEIVMNEKKLKVSILFTFFLSHLSCMSY
jgi:hypothetical protein